MYLYGDISKVDAEQRMVWGYASTEAVDHSGEIVQKAAIEAALGDYLEYANIREMHQLSAVGKAVETLVDDKGLYIGAHIVDDRAWEKVTTGVYKGFSIGGKVLGRDADNRKVITKVLLNEISIVDRPQNPDAKFDVWKSSGAEMKTEETALAEEKPDDIAKAETAEAAPAPEAEPVEPDPVAKAAAAIDKLEAAVAAASEPAPLAKGLYDVSRFAEVVQTIGYLAASAESEAEMEGDNSPVPAKLRAWLAQGAEIFKDMATEEVNELIASATARKAAEAVDLSKAVAEPDAEAVAKAAELDGLRKALTARDEDFAKMASRIDPLVAKVEEMGAELAKVRALVDDSPAPPKTAGPGVAAISKAADATGSAAADDAPALAAEDIKKALDAMDPQERALALIKAAHQFPTVPRVL